MLKLFDGGVYLLNGTELSQSEEEVRARTGKSADKAEAKKGTMPTPSSRHTINRMTWTSSV
jgi:aconitate hydratase